MLGEQGPNDTAHNIARNIFAIRQRQEKYAIELD
jgi:hypothetical protein